jgi:hypothetical protein
LPAVMPRHSPVTKSAARWMCVSCPRPSKNRFGRSIVTKRWEVPSSYRTVWLCVTCVSHKPSSRHSTVLQLSGHCGLPAVFWRPPRTHSGYRGLCVQHINPPVWLDGLRQEVPRLSVRAIEMRAQHGGATVFPLVVVVGVVDDVPDSTCGSTVRSFSSVAVCGRRAKPAANVCLPVSTLVNEHVRVYDRAQEHY